MLFTASIEPSVNKTEMLKSRPFRKKKLGQASVSNETRSR